MITVSIVQLILCVAVVAIACTLSGVVCGVMYAKYEYSIYSKKFKEGLDKKQKEYEEKIKELQEQDAKAVRFLQNEIKKSMGDAILNKMSAPIPEKFN